MWNTKKNMHIMRCAVILLLLLAVALVDAATQNSGRRGLDGRAMLKDREAMQQLIKIVGEQMDEDEGIQTK